MTWSKGVIVQSEAHRRLSTLWPSSLRDRQRRIRCENESVGVRHKTGVGRSQPPTLYPRRIGWQNGWLSLRGMLNRRVEAGSTNLSGRKRYKVAARATRNGATSALHPSFVQAHLVGKGSTRGESPYNSPSCDVIAIPRKQVIECAQLRT